MSLSISTFTKSDLDGTSVDGPSLTLWLRTNLARPVTAHNELDSLLTLCLSWISRYLSSRHAPGPGSRCSFLTEC